MTSLYGDVIISNHCPNSVYATEVGSSQTALRTLIPNQSTVFPIEVRDDGGFSIKITTTNLDNGVLQFEYTEQDDTLWWDLSLINKGNGTRMFVEEGINATTSCEGGKNVDCPAGDSCCHENLGFIPVDDPLIFCSSPARGKTLDIESKKKFGNIHAKTPH
ncbi:antigenic thaumatin domain protein [Penicillium frequentans]|nr:antigenic thaumatin domain protein [Penicillium glabrum]